MAHVMRQVSIIVILLSVALLSHSAGAEGKLESRTHADANRGGRSAENGDDFAWRDALELGERAFRQLVPDERAPRRSRRPYRHPRAAPQTWQNPRRPAARYRPKAAPPNAPSVAAPLVQPRANALPPAISRRTAAVTAPENSLPAMPLRTNRRGRRQEYGDYGGGPAFGEPGGGGDTSKDYSQDDANQDQVDLGFNTGDEEKGGDEQAAGPNDDSTSSAEAGADGSSNNRRPDEKELPPGYVIAPEEDDWPEAPGEGSDSNRRSTRNRRQKQQPEKLEKTAEQYADEWKEAAPGITGGPPISPEVRERIEANREGQETDRGASDAAARDPATGLTPTEQREWQRRRFNEAFDKYANAGRTDGDERAENVSRARGTNPRADRNDRPPGTGVQAGLEPPSHSILNRDERASSTIRNAPRRRYDGRPSGFTNPTRRTSDQRVPRHFADQSSRHATRSNRLPDNESPQPDEDLLSSAQKEAGRELAEGAAKEIGSRQLKEKAASWADDAGSGARKVAKRAGGKVLKKAVPVVGAVDTATDIFGADELGSGDVIIGEKEIAEYQRWERELEREAFFAEEGYPASDPRSEDYDPDRALLGPDLREDSPTIRASGADRSSTGPKPVHSTRPAPSMYFPAREAHRLGKELRELSRVRAALDSSESAAAKALDRHLDDLQKAQRTALEDWQQTREAVRKEIEAYGFSR